MKDTAHYKQLLEQLEQQLTPLPDKPEETAQSTLHALWHLSAGQAYSVEKAEKHPLPELTHEQYTQLSHWVNERLEGKPLSHITGRQTFMGLEMEVNNNALIPRKETEILAKLAISLIQEATVNCPAPIVIDVCTGMGNLPLAYAHHCPKATILAADLSEKAIDLAKQNAKNLKLTNHINWYTGDLLQPIDTDKYTEQIDLICCNPPYISSGKLETMPSEIIGYEPEMAFNGGPFGVKILTRLLKEALPYLKPEGWLCFEVGLGQGPGMQKLLERNQAYKNIRTAADNQKNIRALAAQKNNQ